MGCSAAVCSPQRPAAKVGCGSVGASSSSAVLEDAKDDDVTVPRSTTSGFSPEQKEVLQQSVCDLSFPNYWKALHLDPCPSIFLDTYRSKFGRTLLQCLFDTTYLSRSTRDRVAGSTLAKRLETVAVVRLENSELWHRYAERRHSIALARSAHGCQPTTQPVDPPVRTDAGLPYEVKRGLDARVNEVYLFHGTTFGAAQKILQEGFRLDLAGTNRGSLFGAGIYFAEAASKADEYTSGDSHLLHVMLVCRVCLGEVLRVTQGDAHLSGRLHDKRCDSVLGDRELAVGTYREYVIYNEEQSYPEFAVIYRRSSVVGKRPAAPVLVHADDRVNSHCVSSPDLLLVDGLGHGGYNQVLTVPPNFRCLLSPAFMSKARMLRTTGTGSCDVLLADTTGDGIHDICLVAETWSPNDWAPLPPDSELPMAALLGDLAAVKKLAAAEENLSKPRLRGLTALEIAAANQHQEVRSFLLKAIQEKDARRWAASREHVRGLLASGGDPYHADVQIFLSESCASLKCTLLRVDEGRRIPVDMSVDKFIREILFREKHTFEICSRIDLAQVDDVVRLEVAATELVDLGLVEDIGWPMEIEAVRATLHENELSCVACFRLSADVDDLLDQMPFANGIYISLDSEASRNQLLELARLLMEFNSTLNWPELYMDFTKDFDQHSEQGSDTMELELPDL